MINKYAIEYVEHECELSSYLDNSDKERFIEFLRNSGDHTVQIHIEEDYGGSHYVDGASYTTSRVRTKEEIDVLVKAEKDQKQLEIQRLEARLKELKK